MPLSLKTHHFQRIPGTTTVRLAKLTPYVRLSEGDGPTLFLQDGQVWSEGGDEPIAREALPPWFEEAVARLTPKVRVEVGWGQPGDPVPAAPVVVEDAPKRRPRLGQPRGG